MDHFEGILATLLEAEDYWIRRSFKVNVTKEIQDRCQGDPDAELVTLVRISGHSFRDSGGLIFRAFRIRSETYPFLQQRGERVCDKEHKSQPLAYHFAALAHRDFVK